MIDHGGSQPAPRVMFHRLHLEVGLTLLGRRLCPERTSELFRAIANVTFLWWQLYDYSFSPVIWDTLLFPAAVHEACQCSYRPTVWRRLRSASSHELSVPRTRLSTYGDRAFPVAAVQIWNSLPQHVTSAPSLPVFCTRLKTYFFKLCHS